VLLNTVVGEAIVLRKLNSNDELGVIDMLSNELVMQYIGPRRSLSSHEISSWFASTIADYDNDWNRWAIALKSTDEFIGMVGIRSEEDGYDFGYYLRQKFWGKGIATQAVQMALTEILKHNVAFHIFIANDNTHSQNIMTRLSIRHGKSMIKNGEDGVLYTHTQMQPRL